VRKYGKRSGCGNMFSQDAAQQGEKISARFPTSEYHTFVLYFINFRFSFLTLDGEFRKLKKSLLRKKLLPQCRNPA
jgi:hypothetical protein